MGGNQCDEAGWHSVSTEKRAVIAPLLCMTCRGKGEGQSNHESEAGGGCVQQGQASGAWRGCTHPASGKAVPCVAAVRFRSASRGTQ